jgi:hypothetical protein
MVVSNVRAASLCIKTALIADDNTIAAATPSRPRGSASQMTLETLFGKLSALPSVKIWYTAISA